MTPPAARRPAWPRSDARIEASAASPAASLYPTAAAAPAPPRLRRLDADDVIGAAQSMLEAAAAGAVCAAAFAFRRPAIILGSAQAPTTVRADCPLPVTRRGTGGGAVLVHPGLLDVTVALPARHPLLAGDLTESYHWFGAAFAGALADLGLQTSLVSISEARGMPVEQRQAARIACFAGVSPYEVVTRDGGKLVGFAQRRRHGAGLIHAALALRRPHSDLLRYLNAPGTEPWLERSMTLDRLGIHTTPTETWRLLAPRLWHALNAIGQPG